jgi:hypothetical protein
VFPLPRAGYLRFYPSAVLFNHSAPVPENVALGSLRETGEGIPRTELLN